MRLGVVLLSCAALAVLVEAQADQTLAATAPFPTWPPRPKHRQDVLATPETVSASPAASIDSVPQPVSDTANSTAVADTTPSPTTAPTNTTTPSETPKPEPTTVAPPTVTVAPTSTPAPAPAPAPAAATPAPTAYTPPPIPEATADSTTFKLVDNVICSDDVAKTIYNIYTQNRALFDTCAKDSAYQIFPYSGEHPTDEQIHALATTEACTVLFTACVVANLPECDSSGISLKAVTESLLKVTEDVHNNKSSPDSDRFHEMHIWRRNSNLAKAAGVPYGNDSAIYAEYARDVPAALAKYSVQVSKDLTIQVTSKVGSDASDNYSFDSAGSSLTDVMGGVHPNLGSAGKSAADQSGASSSGSAETAATRVNTKSAATAVSSTVLGFVAFAVVGTALL